MILVLDTETCGDIGHPYIYDLGYLIANNQGEIVQTRSFVIKENFDNLEVFKTAFYNCKRPLYLERLKSGGCKRVRFKKAYKTLIKDINRYKVNMCFAYNSPFDTRALKNTALKFNIKPHDFHIINIMKFSGEITKTNRYIKFCSDNGFLTETNRVSRTAETLTRYLKKDTSIIEEHTALEDSKLELEILFNTWLGKFLRTGALGT